MCRLQSPSPCSEQWFRFGWGLFEFYARAVDPDVLVDDAGKLVPLELIGVGPSGRQAFHVGGESARSLFLVFDRSEPLDLALHRDALGEVLVAGQDSPAYRSFRRSKRAWSCWRCCSASRSVAC